MKKVIITIWLCLFSTILFAQISPVFDAEKDEIFGYLVVTFIEKVDRKNSRYMASLLDVNLNGVSQNTFVNQKNRKLLDANYNGSHIYFEMANSAKSNSKKFSYHLYDLKKNNVSEEHHLSKQHRKTYVYDSYPIKNKGFGIHTRNIRTNVNRLDGISNENEKLYESYPYEKKKKRNVEYLDLVAMKDNVLATIVRKKPSQKSSESETTILLIDTETGKTINDLSLDSDQSTIDLKNIQFIDDKLIVYGDLYKEEEKISNGKTAGLFKATLDYEGNVLDQQERTWSHFQSEMDIDEEGLVSDKGFILTHDFIFDRGSKNTVVIGEYIRGVAGGIEMRDVVFLELDEDFNLQQVTVEEKQTSTFSTSLLRFSGSRSFKNKLRSDYQFFNTLENQNGLAFIFSDYREKMFSTSLTHNIISYKDGEFTNIDLEGKMGAWWEREHLILSISKPGYILISKVSQYDREITDFRLEKVSF